MPTYCGAKKRDGSSCRQRVKEEGKRCRMHGGHSTGPRTEAGRKRVSQNLMRHGIYSRHFTEEELELAEERAKPENLLSLTQEILTAQIELHRGEALMADRRGGNGRAGLELVEVESGQQGGDNGGRGPRQRFAMPDLRALKDRYLGRIASLKRTQKELLQEAPELSLTIQTKDYRDEVLSRLSRKSGHKRASKGSQ